MSDVFVGVVGIAFVFAIALTVARWRARLLAPWRVEKHTASDGSMVVQCVKPGEQPWVIGELTPGIPNRGLVLAELRAEAEEACIELNAGRKPSTF